MEHSMSLYVESNNADDVCYETDKKSPLFGTPLEGTRILADGVILRFRQGLLDGDSETPDGKRIVQPAIEAAGHIEYWRRGRLHRDDGLPAVSSNGFNQGEWWDNGKLSKAE